MQGWGIVLAALAYLMLLFVVASYGDRRRRGIGYQRSRPAIYALSLAIYCTSWTFFGSVGLAATSGLDFLAIYLGPILMMTVGFPIFNHIVKVAKAERITSIADFIASRYGKNTTVGALAAIIAVLGTVPYIALQLKAISSSVDIMVNQYRPNVLEAASAPVDTSFFVSLLLALFAILFGTRHADATEHQDGLMLAVATESIVKLIAFLTAGVLVTFFIFDGIGDMLSQAETSAFVQNSSFGDLNPIRFLVFTLLSFCAFVLLPRQFHVGVVENHSDQETRAARWLFPAYLILINLFVLPVALGGMLTFGSSGDADTYVLALPLNADASITSLVVFVGGLSAATAMVIVACVALAIMISNNLVLPAILRHGNNAPSLRVRDMAPLILNIRRTSIFGILILAYGYFQIAGDSAALASIGLLSFAAVAQFAPAFFGGLFWRGGTAHGAVWGMCAGFAVWAYTLFLPTVLDTDASLVVEGLFGLMWLRPQSLFGVVAEPLNHGVLFSLLINTIVFVAASLVQAPRPIERLQANTFWTRNRLNQRIPVREGHTVSISELKTTVSNYLGQERSTRSFDSYYLERGGTYDSRELADDNVILFAEQLLASAIGAASSRLVISLLLQTHDRKDETTIQLLGDASEALQYNHDLLQTALDQVDQGISVFDNEFRLSSWNRQFRALLELPKELGQVGTPLSDLASAIEDNTEPVVGSPPHLAKRLLEIDQPWQFTKSETGEIIEVQTKSVPDGGVVISWNDITQRVNTARSLQTSNETLERRVRERTEELTRLNEALAVAREAAEAANIGKTKFLAAVGHDVLQPLNAARLYTSSLVEQLTDDRSQQLAGNVDDALESVEDILGAVLEISRLDAGALTPNLTVFPVSKLFTRLQIEFEPIANAKDLKLVVHSNDLSVFSDYGLVRRLLQNLVSNSIKYTHEGLVTLDARVKKGSVVFEVSDTGHGISETDREKVFNEFHRLEIGKKSAAGLGLGLSIVKRIAETLGHSIEFTSLVGSGTVFQVAVPLAFANEIPLDEENVVRSNGTDLTDMSVICIDNEPRILSGMQTLLSGWGCNVEVFESWPQLSQKLDSLQPDIIVADYHLENENGLEVIASVRNKFSATLPAVLITADRSSAVYNSAQAVEVTVLQKPLKPAALRAVFSREMGRNFNSNAAE